MKNENLGEKGYKRFESRADEYINDGDKAAELLENARKKAGKKKGSLSKIWGRVQLLFGLLDDWIKGRYKVIPTKSIIMIIVAVTYFVIPLDLLPDFIIGLGFIDDVAVLGFVIGQINNDLEDYKTWKELNSGEVEVTAEEEA
ncbi:MAG: YkvA family protein [Eubacteriales bacterium]